METADVPGIKLSGLIFDAGPVNSQALLVVGARGDRWQRRAESADDPALVQDVFFRIGGAAPGQATDSLIVNSDYSILDDVWASSA
jgi:hypothetical protein